MKGNVQLRFTLKKNPQQIPWGAWELGLPLQSHPKLIKGNLRIHGWWFSHWIVSDSRDPMDWSPLGSSVLGFILLSEWPLSASSLRKTHLKDSVPFSRGHAQAAFSWERVQFSSVQFSHSVLSNSLWLHVLQHARPPCPIWTPGAYANSCPLSWWCHPTISSSVIPFSSCLQSFPASGSFLMSQFFESGGQSIGVSSSTSILPMNMWDWFPLGNQISLRTGSGFP